MYLLHTNFVTIICYQKTFCCIFYSFFYCFYPSPYPNIPLHIIITMIFFLSIHLYLSLCTLFYFWIFTLYLSTLLSCNSIITPSFFFYLIHSFFFYPFLVLLINAIPYVSFNSLIPHASMHMLLPAPHAGTGAHCRRLPALVPAGILALLE